MNFYAIYTTSRKRIKIKSEEEQRTNRTVARDFSFTEYKVLYLLVDHKDNDKQ